MRDAAFGWLALGVALHLANQVARGRGWSGVIRLALRGERGPSVRDVIAAWVAGAGMGGVLSARGGDAVRLVLLRQRFPEAGYPLLAGTLVAEAMGEAAIGLVLAAAVLAGGLEAGHAPGGPLLAWIAAGLVVGLAAAVLIRSRSRAFRRLTAQIARGCSPLGDPRAYARSVLPWQLASRLLRAGSLTSFLVAFGLPASVAAVGLVMLAQGGGRLLPLAPASLAATMAVLAAGFTSATGAHVDVAAVATFAVGTSTLLTVVGVILAAGIAFALFRGALPWPRVAAPPPVPVRPGRSAASP